MYRTFFKRLLDIILSGCAIVILSPLLLIIAIAIKIANRSIISRVTGRCA